MITELPMLLSAMVSASVSAGLAAAAAWLLLPASPRLVPKPDVRTGTAAPATYDGDRLVPPARGRPGKGALRLTAAAGAGAAALLLVPGLMGLGLAVVAAVVVWRRSVSWDTADERRRRERLAAELPHVVDLMVAALASGAAPGDALERVSQVVGAPLADELRLWLAQLRLGGNPAQVWSDMARHRELGRLGAALHRATESGAPVTDALVRLAEELRARGRADVEARVRQVEVKAAVPLAVCLLPAFLLLGVVPLVAGSLSGLVLAP